jgi:hypothetical protein
MLSNILREKNFNVRQLSHAVHHKAHGHAFDFRVKVQCTLFYLKKFLILITVRLFVMLYWENSHIFRGVLY